MGEWAKGMSRSSVYVCVRGSKGNGGVCGGKASAGSGVVVVARSRQQCSQTHKACVVACGINEPKPVCVKNERRAAR